MVSLSDIDWGKKDPRKPISKTHPYEFARFTNPKKRKVESPPLPAVVPPAKPPSAAESRTAPSPPAKQPHERLLKTNLVLQAYLNLLFNGLVMGIIIMLLIKGIVLVKNDIGVRMDSHIIDQKIRLSECRRQYVVNRCAPGERVPAMESQCQEWEKCMNQDPIRQELGKIILRMASESAEELMSALSVRTIVLATLALVLILKFRR
ncbi:uncharacterized protein NEMAJ01_1283 [Nematocida major]|uniref:uncharacterized protein n=1 Tax=Nematocida major TaxID=1912982 RepID=UPI002007E0C0|nr:uncharacterized protein NEMAJ01_1283 [Nematocida major]KAH9386387.1 hypothetical protein NEMAJ01_1283 [Nematocida major]